MIGLRQNARQTVGYPRRKGMATARPGKMRGARGPPHRRAKKLDERRRPGLEEKYRRGGRVVKHYRRKVMHQRHDQYEMEEVGFYGSLSDGGTDRTRVLVVDRNARRLGPFQMLPAIGRVADSRYADAQQKKPIAGRSAVTAAGDVVQSLAQTGYHRHRGDQEPSDRFMKGTKHGRDGSADGRDKTNQVRGNCSRGLWHLSRVCPDYADEANPSGGGDRSMFSANRLPVKCVFRPKNGPVPSQPVNACDGRTPAGRPCLPTAI